MGNEALERLLNLASLLLETSRPLTLEEIKERLPDHYRQSNLETARRQFERDKEALIEIGINVEMVRGFTDAGVEGYRATRARELQDLDLSPDELAALHLAATSVVLDGADEDEIVTGIHKLGGVVGGEGVPRAKIEMPDAVGPLSFYGETKLLGERAALDAYPEGTWVVRTAWVYDEEGSSPTGSASSAATGTCRATTGRGGPTGTSVWTVSTGP